MEKIEIKKLETDIKAEGILMIRSIEQKIAKSSKPYYALILFDGESELQGNLFNEPPVEDIKSLAGRVVCLKIKTQVYNGKFSCIVDEIDCERVIEDTIKNSFIKYSANPEIHEIYKKELSELVNSIEDKEIRDLCIHVFLNKYYDKFTKYPGGKNVHHSGYGGLLEHSMNLAKLGLLSAKVYEYDYKINNDLIIAGALFQDLGKLFDYDVDELLNVTYSSLISLKGHLIMSNELLYESLFELNLNTRQDKFAQLSHIILSHHSLRANGSPVTPCTPEAILISKLDKLDSEMKSAFAAISTTRAGEKFTQRLLALDNTAVLMPGVQIYEVEDNGDKEEESESNAEGELLF
jgi:3'-5' exoribonuclease